MKLKYLILAMLWLSLCSITSIMYRGVYYEITNISRDELINRIDDLVNNSDSSELRAETHTSTTHPILFAYFLPKGMDAVIHCEINIDDATKVKAPEINFTSVMLKEGDVNKPKMRFLDINSDDLTKEESRFYMAKFESEILSKLGVEWVRNEPSDLKFFFNHMVVPLVIVVTILVVVVIIIFAVHYYKKRLKRRSQA